MEEGSNVVYGIRNSRNEGFLIKNLRKVFYRVIYFLSEDNLPLDAGDFRLIDRRIIDELKQIQTYKPYLRGIIASMGFIQVGIPYERINRKFGESKFNMSSNLGLAFDGILNHSIIPLRIATYTSLVISVFTTLAIFFYLVGKYMYGQDWQAGFVILAVLILFSITLNSIFLGIMGEYISKIYRGTQTRSSVILEKTLNFNNSDDKY